MSDIIGLQEAIDDARNRGDLIDERSFTDEVLNGVDATHLEFESVVFTRCRFERCDFSHASFKSVVFDSCDLSNCRFAHSHWQRCALRLSKADGSDFTKSGFHWTELTRSGLPYIDAVETTWEHCSVSECDLHEAYLSRVHLKKTTLSDTDLTRVELFQTPLKDIDLSSCAIDGITLSDTHAELRGALVNVTQAAQLALMLGVKIV
jgi:uncharacterized protein YjbI with pentapeptide repeats